MSRKDLGKRKAGKDPGFQREEVFLVKDKPLHNDYYSFLM
jgi:hypothetical protein